MRPCLFAIALLAIALAATPAVAQASKQGSLFSAIVCADTEAHARAAADKVKVDLEVLPAYLSAPAAMAEDALEIHPGTPNVYFELPIVKGEDTAPLMKKAAYVVEDEFYLQRQPHLTIEPDVGFAYMDEEGRLTIHSKSIGIHLHHAMIQAGLGIPADKLRLVQNGAGGTFGYKFSPTMEALLGVACMATNRPVFLKYNYYQHITYTGKRSPFWMKIKMGADKKGKLIAMETDWTVDHGSFFEFGDLLTLRRVQHLIEADAVDLHHRVVERDDILRGDVHHLLLHVDAVADVLDDRRQ